MALIQLFERQDFKISLIFEQSELLKNCSCFMMLTKVGYPWCGWSNADQYLLVCEVEWHGELSEGGDQGVGGGHQLPGHAVHADDEQPLTEPGSQPGGYSDCHGLIMEHWVGLYIIIEEGVGDEKESTF